MEEQKWKNYLSRNVVHLRFDLRIPLECDRNYRARFVDDVAGRVRNAQEAKFIVCQSRARRRLKVGGAGAEAEAAEKKDEKEMNAERQKKRASRGSVTSGE